MNEITCKICGDKFTPFKSKKYEVVVTSPLGGNYISEAFDCPMCGCQHIVNRRYPSTNELKENKVIENKVVDRIDIDYILKSKIPCNTCKCGDNMTVLRCRECGSPLWKNYEPKTESERRITCKDCKYCKECIMSAPDGIWKSCDDFEPRTESGEV